MKKYELYIKSHTDFADYEDEVDATSMEEAALRFENRLPIDGKTEGWDAKTLMEHIQETDRPAGWMRKGGKI